MKKITIILLFLCTLLLTACREDVHESKENAEFVSESNEASEQVEPLEITSETYPDVKRKISYTAHVEIVIEDMSKTVKQVTAVVQTENGYVASSDMHHNEKGNKTGRLTVKIPQEKFSVFLEKLDDLSLEILHENIQAEDVTDEYVDLTARLKAKQSVMKRLETFLEEAKTTKELLDVMEQMGKVQTEIEQIEGRLNVLKNQTDYAVVTITMTEKGGLNAAEQNTWLKAKQLFVSTVNAILSFFSGTVVIVVGLSPIIFPLIVIGFGIYRYLKRKQKKK